MEELEVKIKCSGAIEVTLDELQELHHFKVQSDDDYARLHNVLIDRGFKFPFSVWIDPEGVKWTVDGRSRLKTLKRMREEGGIKLPVTFPAIQVTAESKKDAAKDIIASETKFADINPSDFTEFLTENEIVWEDVDSWADIPGLVSDDEENKSDGGSKKPKSVECPSCGNKFDI